MAVWLEFWGRKLWLFLIVTDASVSKFQILIARVQTASRGHVTQLLSVWWCKSGTPNRTYGVYEIQFSSIPNEHN
jgi:hypothetical protein